jgi:hypothetical protein
MQNMQNMTWLSWPIILLHHRNKGTLVLLHFSVGLCADFEQEQKLSEPDCTHPELKRAV